MITDQLRQFIRDLRKDGVTWDTISDATGGKVTAKDLRRFCRNGQTTLAKFAAVVDAVGWALGVPATTDGETDDTEQDDDSEEPAKPRWQIPAEFVERARQRK